MIKKILPLISLILGLAAGGATAIVLAPTAQDTAVEGGEAAHERNDVQAGDDHGSTASDTEIVKLPNQFVVPVILDNRVRAMVILTVALEVEPDQADQVRTLEPKLRDIFLAELFDLAALDGFRDELISRKTLELVKASLTQRAKDVLNHRNVRVLVTDMARQDVH
ncbi:flagellar basal body-associated FliL family protein [Marivita sp. S2033]|uniref:flagellar basal body-associated FliL family protein n=1 Tax=Marivita sp. S2033 TaxID=3373187 RepID=UPI003981E485